MLFKEEGRRIQEGSHRCVSRSPTGDISLRSSTAWLHRLQAGERLGPLFQPRQMDPDPRRLGVLAFEVCRTMSQLVGLYRALSDQELHDLFSAKVSSEGVAYLNSADKRSLLRLACAEMFTDLDAAAASTARLGWRFTAVWARGFHLLYADLRAGKEDMSHLFLGFPSKDIDKKIRKMNAYVAATSTLYDTMEDVAQLEAMELRRQGKSEEQTELSSESLLQQLNQTKNRVLELREESLWSRSFEKVAELMARAVVSIYARLCTVFRPFVPELPIVKLDRKGRVTIISRHYYGHHQPNKYGGIYSSGPLERPYVGNLQMRNSGPILQNVSIIDEDESSWNKRILKPPENTLGDTGIALRHAEVVIFLEKLAASPELVVEESRNELYRKLPKGVRGAVMAKLRRHRKMDDGGGPSDALAGGWREAVKGILKWLGPIARDTVKWQSQRSHENRGMNSESKVLMMQTMIFSDREKAEAAIVELLVAFSYVCRYS